MLDQVLEVKQELAGDHKNIGQKTIFYDMLTNDQVRQEEKETEHLVTEAQVVVAAGIVTTAHTLSTIAFYVLNNPEVLKRLQQELAAVMGDTNSKPSWQVLEGLLYLVSSCCTVTEYYIHREVYEVRSLTNSRARSSVKGSGNGCAPVV